MPCSDHCPFKCLLNPNPNPLGCVQNRIEIGGFGTVGGGGGRGGNFEGIRVETVVFFKGICRWYFSQDGQI